MTDTELRDALLSLGIDETTQGVVGVLPLIQVAWSDGEVDPKEREMILEYARRQGFASEEGMRALDNWLTHAPSPAYLEKGTVVLMELAARSRRTFSDLISLCEAVAAAAGGFFKRVEPCERQTITRVATLLRTDADAAWQTLIGRHGFESHEEEWLDDENTGIGLVPHRPPPPLSGSAGLAWAEENEERVRSCPERLTIGRGRDNDVQFPHDGRASRHHCEIFRRGGNAYVKDLSSLNGTWVNGERVVERRLFGGETILVGETPMRWRG